MQPLTILWVGLILGLRHAVDADHVVAVTAIAARTRRILPATLLGVIWGLGHTLTLITVAGAIILFNWAVPPRLALTMELCVGVALVVLGLVNVRSHRHPLCELEHRPGSTPTSRAFLVGVVHGLAGSAAVALLVLSTVRDPRWALGYVLVFGLGTLVGMAIITTGFALPVVTAVGRWRGAGRFVRLATGVLSLVFGLWIVYDIGWRDGLFLATVNWTPR
jgi:high-affinity nickel-transport protein